MIRRREQHTRVSKARAHLSFAFTSRSAIEHTPAREDNAITAINLFGDFILFVRRLGGL
jgi:hypothetical protein